MKYPKSPSALTPFLVLAMALLITTSILTVPASAIPNSAGCKDGRQHIWQIESPSTATCISAGVITYRCSTCGAIQEEAVPAQPNNHNWSSWTTTKAPACTEIGEQTRTCSVCNAKETEELPALGHILGSAWLSDGTTHWQECTRCHAHQNTTTHSWSTAWSSDSKGHWRVCTVCQAKESSTPHSLSTAWSGDASNHWKVCTVCQSKQSTAAHTWSTAWSHDASGHWKTCTVCQTRQTTVAHTWNSAWSYDNNAHWQVCSACQETQKYAAHTWNKTLSYDNSGHWQGCSTCQAKLNYSPHTLNSSGKCTSCAYAAPNSANPSNGYQITFQANGGVFSNGGTAVVVYTVNNTVTPPVTPTRSGNYVFDGWYDAPTGGNRLAANTVFRANTTLYAHWIQGHTVTFSIPNGAVNGPASPQRITTSNGRAVAATPSYSGWTFRGWTTTPTTTFAYTGQPLYSTEVVNATTVTADTNYYAVFQQSRTNVNISASLLNGTGVLFSDAAGISGGTSIQNMFVNQMNTTFGNGSTLSYVAFGANQTGTSLGTLYSDRSLRLISTSTKYYFTNNNNTSNELLGNVYFLPTGQPGTWTIPYVAVDIHGNTASGTFSLTLRGDAVDKIIYYSTGGSVAAVNVEDFNRLFNHVYPGQILSYVQFDAANNLSDSNGYLYYQYGRGDQVRFTNTTIDDYKFYYNDSTKGNYPLSGLSFVPGPGINDFTVSVLFTAYSTSGMYFLGSMEIMVNAIGDAKVGDILFSAIANTELNFEVSDFSDAFTKIYPKDSLSYVTLRGIPSVGSLYYEDTTALESKRTAITYLNYEDYKFYASNNDVLISDLSYLPNGSNYQAAIPFVAYGSQGTNRIQGNLLINVTNAAVSEVYLVTTAKTALSMNAAAISAAVQIATNQTLTGIKFMELPDTDQATLSYTTSNGSTRPATTDLMYSYNAYGEPSIDSVRFLANETGSFNIPYVAYNGSSVPIAYGTINIGVVNEIHSFSDVPSSSWFYKYVTELSGIGVINGMPDGTFAPNRNVTYGEALKLILLAAGVCKELPVEGSHWASSYLELAKLRGYLTADVDLNSYISRQEVAALASNAMSLTGFYGGSPFADSTDVSVRRLYEAGIITGVKDTDGKMYFYPDAQLSRAEIAAIIWRIHAYNDRQT